MNNEIIDKIKKLLRMKRGGTMAEIETALAMAQKLAEEHGINLADVNPDEQSEERRISQAEAMSSSRIQWEHKYAMLLAKGFFNVTTLMHSVGYRRVRITFIGAQCDIQISLYVYNFLVGAMRRAWTKRPNQRLRNRQMFLYGMYIALWLKLSEQRPKHPEDSNALIVIKSAVARREKYMADHFGETEKSSCVPDGDAQAAKLAGIIAGDRTTIRPAVEQKGSSLLLN